jgi:hypothetical protein
MSEDAARLKSEIAQLEARYDGGAMPPGIYLLVVRLRNELARMERAGSGERRRCGISIRPMTAWGQKAKYSQ